ncbi:hypothetical protein [Pseudoalteromonas sp. ASV78]|uniref:hypothetical protein n=1 Tax=Pseudoalteromonas sp. ASV78 TaxID=3397851 RepID=UPI0039FC7594
MENIIVNNFIARNSTPYDSVLVTLKELSITRSNNTTISLGADNIENTNSRTNVTLSFQFSVFKDEEALIGGAEAIETLRVSNPDYVEGVEHPVPKNIEYFHLALTESVTDLQAKEKAYQHLIDMNTIEVDLT